MMLDLILFVESSITFYSHGQVEFVRVTGPFEEHFKKNIFWFKRFQNE